jgi:hypothetical protein
MFSGDAAKGPLLWLAKFGSTKQAVVDAFLDGHRGHDDDELGEAIPPVGFKVEFHTREFNLPRSREDAKKERRESINNARGHRGARIIALSFFLSSFASSRLRGILFWLLTTLGR